MLASRWVKECAILAALFVGLIAAQVIAISVFGVCVKLLQCL